MPALLADIARAIDQGELTVAQDRRRVRGVVDFERSQDVKRFRVV